MPWLKNELVAALRTATFLVVKSDGQSPADTTAVFGVVQAFLNLNGIATGSLANVILTLLPSAFSGAAGNAVTIATVNDGTSGGSLTQVGSAYTFHFSAGVTTVNQMIAALAALASFSGTYTGTNTLAAGDVFAAHSFAGGEDSAIFIRARGGGAWATAAGTLTNIGIRGYFEYAATQPETNFDCPGWDLRIGTPDVNGQFTKGGVLYNCSYTGVDARRGSWDDLEEGTYTHADMARAKTALLMGKVANFLTNALAFLSVDGTKTRISGTTDTTGRNANPTIGDLTGP